VESGLQQYLNRVERLQSGCAGYKIVKDFRDLQVNFMRVYLHFCEVFAFPFQINGQGIRRVPKAATASERTKRASAEAEAKAEPGVARFLPKAKMSQ